jgi:HAD superfamily hydrolase (TIGR01457 family)
MLPIVTMGKKDMPEAKETNRRMPGESSVEGVDSLKRLNFDAFIIDLDGCVYRGETPIPGAGTAIAALMKKGKKILFVTNNSTDTPGGFSKKLRGMGIEVPPSMILTSSVATAIQMRALDRGKVFMIGETGLKEALEGEGFEIVGEGGAGKAEYVVTGLDRALTYGKVAAACSAISRGAKYLATNDDPVLPYEGGYLPGAGAIVSMIRTVTGKRPLVMGKPSKRIITTALGLLKTSRERVAIVGDAIGLDIRAGKRAGLFSILVLTGVSKREDVEKSTIKPDLVLDGIGDLLERV